MVRGPFIIMSQTVPGTDPLLVFHYLQSISTTHTLHTTLFTNTVKYSSEVRHLHITDPMLLLLL